MKTFRRAVDRKSEDIPPAAKSRFFFVCFFEILTDREVLNFETARILNLLARYNKAPSASTEIRRRTFRQGKIMQEVKTFLLPQMIPFFFFVEILTDREVLHSKTNYKILNLARYNIKPLLILRKVNEDFSASGRSKE